VPEQQRTPGLPPWPTSAPPSAAAPAPATDSTASLDPEAQRQEILRQAHAEAEAIRGELPLLQVSLNYELTKAREQSARADTRLAEAHDEAQALVKDAAHQASLVAEAAERAGEQMLADARLEAADQLARARAAAAEIAAQSEQVVARERQAVAELREQVSAELVQLRAEHERGQMDRETAHSNTLASRAAAAALEVQRTQADADETAAKIRAGAQQELTKASADADALRAAAREQVNQLLEGARAETAQQLAAAAEQTAWTKKTVAGLVEAAELDAQGIRQRAYDDAVDLIARTRRRLGGVLNHSRQALDDRRTAAALVEAEAQFRLDDAHHDAEEIREQAAEHARHLIAEAEDDARALHDRADRRLTEAESGARSLREHSAEEIERSHRELHELRRATKAEAVRAMEQARAEADEVRSLARTLLADARTEVATLIQQRDEIAKELGSLSGIIDALAVPDDPHPDSTTSPDEPALSAGSEDPSSSARHDGVDADANPSAPPEPPAAATSPVPAPPTPPESHDTEKMRAL
jgi:hypothetical protein